MCAKRFNYYKSLAAVDSCRLVCSPDAVVWRKLPGAKTQEASLIGGDANVAAMTMVELCLTFANVYSRQPAGRMRFPSY